MTEIKQTQKLLESNNYFTLATADANGTPWISNVFFSHDKNYTFYWYSRIETRHSQNISIRPQIALNLYISPENAEVDGLYIEAIASEVKGMSNVIAGMMTYASKALKVNVMTKQAVELFMKHPEDFLLNSPFRLYQAIPQKIWKYVSLENYKDKYVDGRLEISLEELKAAA